MGWATLGCATTRNTLHEEPEHVVHSEDTRVKRRPSGAPLNVVQNGVTR
jgi:hypothetical protein